ncbi:hypothetical protein [Corynebacterium auris]|uniref:hypothetical protein n=1 Tax=Corynebacterium auris TaxID=44750 RepID=UPI0025B47841|nr:hypothetical protein [Corynebacterium auris]WJY68172.1 hypothetical protein CAURIS_06350 [Corynebacterium auris]
MKLRKGFLAAATAASIVAAGVAAPAHAEEPGGGESTTTADPTPDSDDSTGGSDKPVNEEGSSAAFGSSEDFSKLDPKEKGETIKTWLSVATAVIGVLSAVATFVAKFIPLSR